MSTKPKIARLMYICNLDGGVGEVLNDIRLFKDDKPIYVIAAEDVERAVEVMAKAVCIYELSDRYDTGRDALASMGYIARAEKSLAALGIRPLSRRGRKGKE